MNVQFKKWNCIAKGAYYGNGNKAITLIDAVDNQPIATATVNMVKENIDNDMAFIKDYSENEGMTDALIEANIIHPGPFKVIQTGYVSVGLYRFTFETLKELFNEDSIKAV